MEKTGLSIFIAAMLLPAVLPAHAAIVTQTLDFAVDLANRTSADDVTQTLAFTGFDASLGSLQAVDISLNANETMQTLAYNLLDVNRSVQNAYTYGTLPVSVLGTSLSLSQYFQTQQDANDTVLPGLNLLHTATIGGLSGEQTLSSGLSGYVGNSVALTVDLSGDGLTLYGSCYNMVGCSSDGSAAGSLTVSYVYAPSTSPVLSGSTQGTIPEPATPLLIFAGLLTLRGSRRNLGKSRNSPILTCSRMAP